MPHANLAAILALLASAQLASAAEYSGPAIHIRDGDTFVMRADDRLIPVRLCGVDSPERGHRGYQKAKDALTELLRGKIVRCVQVGANAGTPCDRRSRPRSRDRIVAQCFVDGRDIGIEMIRSDDACDWPKFSNGYYHLKPTTCVRH